MAIRVAELAEVNYRSRLLGQPRPIPAEDVELFRAPSAREQGWRPDASWRYYCRLTGEDGGGAG